MITDAYDERLQQHLELTETEIQLRDGKIADLERKLRNFESFVTTRYSDELLRLAELEREHEAQFKRIREEKRHILLSKRGRVKDSFMSTLHQRVPSEGSIGVTLSFVATKHV